MGGRAPKGERERRRQAAAREPEKDTARNRKEERRKGTPRNGYGAMMGDGRDGGRGTEDGGRGCGCACICLYSYRLAPYAYMECTVAAWKYIIIS